MSTPCRILFAQLKSEEERVLGPFHRHPKPSRVEVDFRRLLERIESRLYPETIPVLASYWLKTVYWSGYSRDEWRALDRLLKRSGDFPETEYCRQAFADIRAWIKTANRRSGKPADPRTALIRRPVLGAESVAPYLIRLLNTWLPQEVARMLVSEPPLEDPDAAGVSVLTTGKALERLLLRERLSTSGLEALLDVEGLSARAVYPADLEILRDVILFLLGQTAALTPAVLPATFLGTPRDARLCRDYPEAIESAYLANSPAGEELHVPIKPNQLMQILTDTAVGIGSTVITKDGRWWEAARLQGGDKDVLVYRPHSRPRIDYTADHARLRVPWPEPRHSWSGFVHFPNLVEVFGRQWTVASWEKDGAHSWLNLVFSRPVPVTMVASESAPELRRCRPASTDLAWAELETAVGAALAQNRWDRIESLQREDLIPLARALFALAQSALSHPKLDTIESNLRRIRFLLGSLDSRYGLIPWRILPREVRKVLLRSRLYSGLLESLQQNFGGLPDAPREPLPMRYLARLAGR
ncbi:MAG TPA: hypothetical protein VKT49_02285 [Bryobacteraceae bacterium]|nr:hypothetical protein [Bryobacteraceae bacterium]